jgi:hypothetical protein
MRFDTSRRPLACALALCLFSFAASAEAPLRLTGPRAGEPVEVAQAFLKSAGVEYGIAAADQEHRVASVAPTRHNGLTHVYLQQTVDGVDVDGAVTTINVMRDGSILSIANAFESSVRERANSKVPRLDAGMAYVVAASYLNVALRGQPTLMGGRGGASRHALFSGGLLSDQPVPAELIYVRDGDRLRLSWNLTIDRFEDETFHGELRIDAETGQVLDLASYVAHASSSARPKLGANGPGYSARYYVLPMPFESPTHPDAALQLVTDPHDLNASPRGWHDTRALGSNGYEFAETRGNNVVARADLTSTNAATNFRTPAVIDSGNLVFNYDWNPDAQPSVGGNQPSQGNVPPAVVNLFYWNNILHDVLWHYGFDEASGNFQVNNFDRGGSGNDAVNADALDGSDLPTPNTNNANFSTPADGSAGRMQMYRWLGPIAVRVDTPYQKSLNAMKGGFGQQLATALSGSFALVNDGGINAGVEGCAALTNTAEVAGKIALVRRGTCEFGLKALNAQNAGAVATIIYNNQGGDAVLSPGPGASGASVTTPVAFIGQSDGDELATALQAGAATGAMLPADLVGPDRDSGFDAGIVGHEYAHGLSNRLTGGRTQATCLNNAEQAGEGWSDYVGLMLTLRSNACAAPRGVGTYASFQPPTGPGIRRFPYSRDRAVNSFTFADTNDPLQSQPHGVGSVWATMLWDMTCNLIDEHGFDADLVRGTGGNNIGMQLVVDGLKLQPCRPGFVQARDAILAADVANSDGENRCLIWRSFAGRGLGLTASSGLNTDRFDQVEAFDLPLDCADHVVTVATSGEGGVGPAPSVGVLTGGRVSFSLTPAAGWQIGSVEGCGGALQGVVYRTAAVTSACTVSVTFTAVSTEIFANGFEAPN